MENNWNIYFIGLKTNEFKMGDNKRYMNFFKLVCQVGFSTVEFFHSVNKVI